MADRAYRRLFAGITMPAEGERKARDILRHAYVRGQVLAPLDSREKWYKLVRIHEQRDSLLLTLLAKSVQKVLLKARLDRERPKRSFWDEGRTGRGR